MLCLFRTELTGFDDESMAGVLKGKLKDKTAIEGRGDLKVFLPKRGF
jgi:hypothetical protein